MPSATLLARGELHGSVSIPILPHTATRAGRPTSGAVRVNIKKNEREKRTRRSWQPERSRSTVSAVARNQFMRTDGRKQKKTTDKKRPFLSRPLGYDRGASVTVVRQRKRKGQRGGRGGRGTGAELSLWQQSRSSALSWSRSVSSLQTD